MQTPEASEAPLRRRRRSGITPRRVDSIPDDLEDGILYISHKYQVAVHLCCCGCGGEVVTPLDHEGWHLTEENGATLSPSIGNFSFPCRSHYFIRRNRVEWC